MKVLNYGSLNVDYVYSVDHIIVGGETQHSSKLEVFSGGKGLNQSIALAKAGVPVYHAGTDSCSHRNSRFSLTLPTRTQMGRSGREYRDSSSTCARILRD